METNLLSAQSSRKRAKDKLPVTMPWQSVPYWPQAGLRAGGHPPDELIAGTCFQSTCLDFPDLSSPFSDLSLLCNPHLLPLSYSLSPFIPVQKQIMEAKCVSWLPGKASLKQEHKAGGGGLLSVSHVISARSRGRGGAEIEGARMEALRRGHWTKARASSRSHPNSGPRI